MKNKMRGEKEAHLRGSSDQGIILEKNLILGGWGRILGATGLALYVTRKAMADDNIAASLQDVADHLAISKKTVRHYDLILELAGMIEIVPGDNHRPNTYIIFNPPQLSDDLRDQLMQEISLHGLFNVGYSKSLRNKLISRIDFVGGLQDSKGYCNRDQQPGRPAIVASNDPVLIRAIDMGIEPDQAKKWIAKYGIDRLAGWLDYVLARDETEKPVYNPASFLPTVIGQQPKVIRTTKRNQLTDLSDQVPEEYKHLVRQ